MGAIEKTGYDYLPGKLPAKIRREVRITDHFKGAADIGGCGDMKNLTHGRAPALATRAPRGLLAEPMGSGTPGGMAIFDGCLYYVLGRGLYRWDGTRVFSLGALSEGGKQFAVFGDRLYIYPDKCYVEAGGSSIRYLELDSGVSLTSVFKGHTVTLPEGKTWTGLGYFPGDCLRVVNADNDIPAPEGYYHMESLNGRVATLREQFPATYESAAYFRRHVPTLERVCVSGDRVYGIAGKEIYISAAGSATDFYSRGDVEGRSGVCLRLDSDGDLTACVAWQGYVIFFKSDRICKLLGTRSDTFTLQERPAVGLTARMAGTLCEVGGDLYYVSESGVCRYRGQEPELISSVGEQVIQSGAGGTDGVAYYLSLLRADGTRTLYCYRPDRNTWLAEDDIQAGSMIRRDGYLCILDADGRLWLTSSDRRDTGCLSDERSVTGAVRASYVLPPDYDFQPQGCRLVGVSLRVTGGLSSAIEVLADFADGRNAKDATGSTWISLGGTVGNIHDRLLHFPLPPTPCDSLRLRIAMTGDWTVHSIIREYEKREQ